MKLREPQLFVSSVLISHEVQHIQKERKKQKKTILFRIFDTNTLLYINIGKTYTFRRSTTPVNNGLAKPTFLF